jgi:hypothetical protein
MSRDGFPMMRESVRLRAKASERKTSDAKPSEGERAITDDNEVDVEG